MLARYLWMIQVQRQDFNGRMLTIRRDDLRAIACILDCHRQVPARLDDLGLRLVRSEDAGRGPASRGCRSGPFGVYVHVPFCAVAVTTAPSPPGPTGTT